MPHSVSIHWFRRDLRLTDNTALQKAHSESVQVIPVYILSDWKEHHEWTGPNRQFFLCGCLASLAANLEAIDSKLIIRSGDALKELEKLLKETKAEAIYTNADIDPFGKEVEKKLAKLCEKLKVVFHVCKDAVLHAPEEALKDDGTPYRVFTPYSKRWLNLEKSPPLGKVRTLGPKPDFPSQDPPTLAHWKLSEPAAKIPTPGERAARERMKDFVSGQRIQNYKDGRNIPSRHDTSGLSPDLRYGLISIRELYLLCQQAEAATTSPKARESIQTYIKELAWREFYVAVLHYWPEVLETDFNPEFRQVRWDSADKDFEAWQQGKTGFPIVDAGMRQLLATGWMHNRLRMITAMFLTKDLHCHWMLGEKFFMQQLVDGEIASNNGGWQWSAGTGADAAPYFRIQNPWLQSKRFDPEGEYIKMWVPELKDVPAEKLHEPPGDGGPLAKGYPLPIVDHHEERDKTLVRFKEGKKSSR